MGPSLETLKAPITMIEGFVQDQQAKMIMRCRDRISNKVALLDESGETLFTTETKL
jgi:hypothetical protein